MSNSRENCVADPELAADASAFAFSDGYTSRSQLARYSDPTGDRGIFAAESQTFRAELSRARSEPGLYAFGAAALADAVGEKHQTPRHRLSSNAGGLVAAAFLRVCKSTGNFCTRSMARA